MENKKTRHEWWREYYRKNRYLKDRSLEYLSARLKYQFESMMNLSPKGQIAVEGNTKLGEWLWAKFTHTLYEFELRNMRPSDGFLKNADVPKATFPTPAREAKCYGKRGRNEPGEIFRFGQKQYLEASLKEGNFRVSPASFYKDPSLNAAIQDDELSFTVYPSIQGGLNSPIGIHGIPSLMPSGGIRLTHPTDYFVQCFSNRHSLRMYSDFSANACLIVYDARQFGDRMIAALETKLKDWIIGAIPVTYVDPDEPGQGSLLIPQVKHMKYCYQLEERIICHPKIPIQSSLTPIMISIGPITDIAELVTLD